MTFFFHLISSCWGNIVTYCNVLQYTVGHDFVTHTVIYHISVLIEASGSRMTAYLQSPDKSLPPHSMLILLGSRPLMDKH